MLTKYLLWIFLMSAPAYMNAFLEWAPLLKGWKLNEHSGAHSDKYGKRQHKINNMQPSQQVSQI